MDQGATSQARAHLWTDQDGSTWIKLDKMAPQWAQPPLGATLPAGAQQLAGAADAARLWEIGGERFGGARPSRHRAGRQKQPPNDTDGQRARFRAQFRKSEMCRFYPTFCNKGDQCAFAHSLEELRPSPDLTKTSICRRWQAGCCLLDSSQCPFAHGHDDLRVTVDYLKSAPCKMYFLRGHCDLGDKCRHAHSLAELRPDATFDPEVAEVVQGRGEAGRPAPPSGAPAGADADRAAWLTAWAQRQQQARMLAELEREEASSETTAYLPSEETAPFPSEEPWAAAPPPPAPPAPKPSGGLANVLRSFAPPPPAGGSGLSGGGDLSGLSGGSDFSPPGGGSHPSGSASSSSAAPAPDRESTALAWLDRGARDIGAAP